MKIKIMTSQVPERLESMYNTFVDEHDVRFTQSHMMQMGASGGNLYVVFIYYEEQRVGVNPAISKLIGR